MPSKQSATSQSLPEHLTKVSYILPRAAKPKLEATAEQAGVSMSEIITRALKGYYADSRKKKLPRKEA